MGALDDYESKRDFSNSPEPRGQSKCKGGGGRPRFVIQVHAARSLQTKALTHAATRVSTQRESVLSGRTVDDVGD